MRLSLLTLLFLLPFYSHTQYTFETYTPANGLVDARVSGMTQDKYGRIIIYTREGFSIYDGQRFSNYLTIDKEDIGIITGSIMLPDSTLYLIRFNGSPIKIEKDKISYDRELLKDISEVSSLNRVNDSTYLILTNYGAYILTNRKSKKIINKNVSIPLELKSTSFGAIQNNKLILYLYNGSSLKTLLLFDLKKEAIIDKKENFECNNITQDKKGNIYLFNNTEVYAVDPEKLAFGKLSYSKAFLEFGKNIKNNFFLDFDNSNNAWLLNQNSDCIKLNSITGEKIFFNYNSGILKGVSGIFQDRENNYWFFFHGKGIQRLVQSNYEEVTAINGKRHRQNKFLHNLPDGSVFINGTEGQFSIEDKHELTLPAASQNAGDEIIFWQNKYWHFKDVNTLQNDLGATIQFNLPDTKSPLSISSKIRTDKEGNLLIGGNVFFLLRKDGKYAAAELPYYTDNIIQDEADNYWAFCRGTFSVIKFKFADGALYKMNEYTSPLAAPRCSAYWNKDTFIVGTRNNGLIFVKAIDNKLISTISITRDHGLSNNFILDVINLGQNKIGIATASGVNIVSFNKDDTAIQNISSEINIYDPISNLVADKSGNLYAISETTGSLYHYTVKQIENTSYLPEAYISSILVNREKITPGKTIFNFRENNFSFDVSAPSYINNRNIKFIFFLNGETNIDLTNTTGNFELNNMKPGLYDLIVKIIYPGNNYPDQLLHYSFKINEPFWKSWWFITLVLSSFAFLTWFFVRNFYRRKIERTKAVLEKELAIEQERTRMARELHDGMGSMLSGIKHSFSALKKDLNLNNPQETHFDSNIEKLNDSIRELRTISHSLASGSLLQSGLVDTIKDYCNSLHQDDGLKISFSSVAMEGVALKEEQAFHLLRIIQELLQNIIKHSGASDAIVQLSYNDNRIYLAVEDNGRGFEMEKISFKKGIGLKNIEARIKILNGTMDIQTEPGKGTSTLIEIPAW